VVKMLHDRIFGEYCILPVKKLYFSLIPIIGSLEDHWFGGWIQPHEKKANKIAFYTVDLKYSVLSLEIMD
jgi:hypothetical protein